MHFWSEFVSELKKSGIEHIFDEPMKRHTSFRIGGNADAVIYPKSKKELECALALCKKYDIPITVLGNCSNVLVSDKGIRGAVIIIGKSMAQIRIEGEKIYAQSGALLSVVGSLALKNALSGFEALCGIPGSVGGALYMNAGAYGAQISDVLYEAEYVTLDGEEGRCTSGQYGGGYRKSIFTDSDKIAVSAVFELEYGSESEIKEKMSEYAMRRSEKQPLSFPSAGSVFKRPEGHFAGALIEQAGLKGFLIGGAQVSEKHAGFIINKCGASAEDVLSLIEHIKKTVFAKSGIELECEIKFIGEK